MSQPVWKTLGATGSHDESVYVEGERAEVYPQFAHPPRRVLDIGCAHGNVGLGIKQAYGEDVYVWGVELTESSAEVARTRLDRVSAHPVEQFSIEELEMLKTMDTVLLLDVLEHMYNPWETLAFLSKHISSDAQIIVSLPNIMNIAVMRDLTEGYFHYTPTGLLDVTHIRFFTPYEMKRMFYQTGYRVESDVYMLTAQTEETIRCRQGPFPVWMQMDKVKVEVQDFNHWLFLNTLQVHMRARLASDDVLSEYENALRYDAHPPTMTFSG